MLLCVNKTIPFIRLLSFNDEVCSNDMLVCKHNYCAKNMFSCNNSVQDDIRLSVRYKVSVKLLGQSNASTIINM